MKSIRSAFGLWLLIVGSLCFATGALAETVIGEAAGKVEIGRGEPVVWSAAASGAALRGGDRIRTGAGGHAELRLGSAVVRLYENSLLRLPDAIGAAGAPRVRLQEGRSLFDVVKRKLGTAPFEVDTPQVVVSVKGTRFEVVLAEALAEVSVFHGTVGLRDPEKSAHASARVETLVREGFAARGGAGLPFELEVSMQPDPWDQWRDVAPAALERGARVIEPQRFEARMVEAARKAAQRSSDPQVIAHAARRSPKLAERLARLDRNGGEAVESVEEAGETEVEDDGAGARRNGRVDRQRARRMMRQMPASPAPGELIREADPNEILESMMENGQDPAGSAPGDDDDDGGSGSANQMELLGELMESGFAVGEIQASIMEAVNAVGFAELGSMYQSGGYWDDALTQEFSRQGHSPEVSELLIELMEHYADPN